MISGWRDKILSIVLEESEIFISHGLFPVAKMEGFRD